VATVRAVFYASLLEEAIEFVTAVEAKEELEFVPGDRIAAVGSHGDVFQETPGKFLLIRRELTSERIRDGEGDLHAVDATPLVGGVIGRGRVLWRALSGARAFDGADDGAGFVAALFIFREGDGVCDDAGSGLDVALGAVHEEGADRDAGV
jgi:hypothetical protein